MIEGEALDKRLILPSEAGSLSSDTTASATYTDAKAWFSESLLMRGFRTNDFPLVI